MKTLFVTLRQQLFKEKKKIMTAQNFKKSTLLVLTLMLATIVLWGTTQIQAQSKGVSLTAIPPRLGDTFDLRAAPGEVIQATVRIKNSSDQPMPIESSFHNFVLSDDGMTPIPLDNDVSNRWSLSSWVTISPKNQILGARQSAVVNVVINVPEDALAGGHYGMVLHQPGVNADKQEMSQANISQRVGTLIYLMVEGEINEEAFIRDFNFPQFSEYGPVPFSFLVENVSDIHIHPQIGVEIYNLLGQKVDTINIETQNVFPFTPRTFKSQWERVWGIGRYQARVIMSYGLENKLVIAQTYFWLLPIKIVISIMLIILAILGIVIAVRRHLIHRRDYNKQKIEMLEREIDKLQANQNQQDKQQEQKE